MKSHIWCVNYQYLFCFYFFLNTHLFFSLQIPNHERVINSISSKDDKIYQLIQSPLITDDNSYKWLNSYHRYHSKLCKSIMGPKTQRPLFSSFLIMLDINFHVAKLLLAMTVYGRSSDILKERFVFKQFRSFRVNFETCGSESISKCYHFISVSAVYILIVPTEC